MPAAGQRRNTNCFIRHPIPAFRMLQPLLADILFVLLTLSVAAGALLGWRTAFRRSSLPPENQRRATRWAVLMGFNWLVFSGALAALGWLRNWHTLPPPLLLVLLPPVGFA